MAELGALRLIVPLAARALVDYWTCLGAGDPVRFPIGGEVDGALVGEALGVEFFSALDVYMARADDELSVEV